ncbi:hypothetical protein H0176_21230 [Methylorubrum populi]|nr:hypothetical protein [Methylorubrum rhodesianum]MBY0142773.1 hypothetical protein [Methylorubrum populi]
MSGTPREVAAATKACGVFAEKVPAASRDEAMNHTATAFPVDAADRFPSAIAPDEPREVAMMKLRLLLGMKVA